MKAEDIATAATALVGGDRKQAYGDVLSGLTRIAILWNGWLIASGAAPARPITPHDVAQMMVSLKQARSVTGPLRMDNFIDMAGWASIAGEAAAGLIEISVSHETNAAK